MSLKSDVKAINESFFHGVVLPEGGAGMIKNAPGGIQAKTNISDGNKYPVQAEYSTDSADKIAIGGIKYDGGKSKVFQGALDYFPRALEAVADISAFGASKYAWKGWESVDDGWNRYSNAMVRHITKESYEGSRDADSGLLHAAHCAWNALARLEMLLKSGVEKTGE